MKKYFSAYLILLILLLTGRFAYSQQWNSYLPVPGAIDINTVEILDPGVIVAGGGRENNDSFQVMIRTQNSGISWQENQHDGLYSWIKSMAFSSNLQGLAVGYQGRIVRSDDGGQNWDNPVFPINRNLNKIFNINGLNYTVGGIKDSLQTIIKSNDSGVTWSLQLDRSGSDLNSVYFTDTLKGIAVGDSGIILKTNNGGSSWNTISPPVVRDFKGLTFLNKDTGYIVGGDTVNKTILKTTNAGATWAVVMDATGGRLNDISFADSLVGYTVGDSATVLKTNDGGLTWGNETISNSLSGDESFTSVKFKTTKTGTIGAKGGRVYIYLASPIELFTLGADHVDSLQAYIYGSVNTHGLCGAYSFTFSNDSTFFVYTPTEFQNLITDSFTCVRYHLGNLTPNRWYYYSINDGSYSSDTLRFYTGGDYSPEFKTSAATVVNSTTLNFQGIVHGYDSVNNILFEYGTSPQLGSQITGNPNGVTDTTLHVIQSTITTAQDAVYYYRLRGIRGTDTLYGDIHYAGNPFPFDVLQTEPVINAGYTGATLRGTLDGARLAMRLYFEYDNSETFTNSVNSSPFIVIDSALHELTAAVTSLQPFTTYYYRVKAVVGSKIYYGNTIAFFTSPTTFETRIATDITDTSATLNGNVNGFNSSLPMLVGFEYGSTSALGRTVSAGMISVNDTLSHQFSAFIGGLSADTDIYYYRMKAIAGGSNYYGNIRQLYKGPSEVPNWDFKNWQTQTVLLPSHWYVSSDSFDRVPGYTGSYALQLRGPTFACLGVPAKPPVCGAAFNSRPDSISAYLKYSIADGDTGCVCIYMTRNGVDVVKLKFYPVTGNSGGVFKKMTFPIVYATSDIPDSIFLGFAPTNPNPHLPNYMWYSTPDTIYSTGVMTVDDISFGSGQPNVPNYSFESWFNYQVEKPQGWFSEYYFVDSANLPLVPMISKQVYSNQNDYAMQIQNTDVAGAIIQGGVNTCANFFRNTPDFAISHKYQSLTGYFAYLPEQNDINYIRVIFKKGGRFGLPIAFGQMQVQDEVPAMTPFFIDMGYTGVYNPYGDLIPDWASIMIGSYDDLPMGHSKLILDKLTFDGYPLLDTALILSDQNLVMEDLNGLLVYPNPANGLINAALQHPLTEEGILRLYNISGQLAKELRVRAGEIKTSFTTEDLQQGFYMLRLETGKAVYNRKISIIR